MSRNEAKTRKELIDPMLKAAGWFDHQWQIDPEYKISAGRINFDGKSANRSRPVYADYLLRYASSKAIAIVEAKAEAKHYLEGERQAKDYATKLGLWYTYSTNGHEIEFFNLKTGTQETVKGFHTPEQLWEMYLNDSGINRSPEGIKALTHDYYDESTVGQRRAPRYYQEKAVNSAIETIINGDNRVLLNMATGTGKTFTSIQLVYKLWKAKFVKKILFIVDRNLLADQAFADFDNAMDKDACYRLSPKDDKFPLGRDLYFGIYQSLVGVDDEDESQKVGRPDRFKEFPKDYFDLIVIDEAHRGARRSKDGKDASSWFKLLEYFDSAIQVGLTATPKRDESNDTYSHFGNPAVTYSLRDGIQDGYLAPYVIKSVTSNIDALGYRPDSGDIVDVRGKSLEVKDYLTPDFERKLSIPQRTRAFAYHLLRHQFSTDPLGKTLVFCLDQRHALDMAKYCRQAFEKYKEKYGLKDYKGDYAVRITGDDKDNSGKYQDLEKFKDLDKHQPVIVTTSKLLTTGVDVKNIKNVVIFRNIGSMVEFKQIIGRGTRTYEPRNIDNEKLGFFILEYANYSTQLFSDPEWDDEPQEFIDEGTIVIDDDTEYDEFRGIPDDADVPVAPGEDEAGTADSDGIYEEPDDDALDNIRYRMSDDFLSGRVMIAAESVSLTGPDGKPMTPDEYVLLQSHMFMEQVKDLEQLNQIWKDVKSRNELIDKTSAEMGVSIDALTSIFFEKHGLRDVDTYDILASLVFGQTYLTKEERILKAREANPAAFDLGNENKNKLVDEILGVYKEMGYSPLNFSTEFFQIPQMRKYGGFPGIKDILGGMDETKAFIKTLQDALYDERIAA
jgi:type I restriction enzyme, R subunit